MASVWGGENKRWGWREVVLPFDAGRKRWEGLGPGGEVGLHALEGINCGACYMRVLIRVLCCSSKIGWDRYMYLRQRLAQHSQALHFPVSRS